MAMQQGLSSRRSGSRSLWTRRRGGPAARRGRCRATCGKGSETAQEGARGRRRRDTAASPPRRKVFDVDRRRAAQTADRLKGSSEQRLPRVLKRDEADA